MKTPEQLSPQGIEEFNASCQEECGHVLSDDEVREIANRLLHILEMLRQSLSGSTSEEPPINRQAHR